MRAIMFSIICLALIGLVSATDLNFVTMFPECVNTTDFSSNVRCGAYFLVPNFHFETMWNCIIGGFFDSVYKSGEWALTAITNLMLPSNEMYNDVQTANVTSITSRFTNFIFAPLIAPTVLLYGIFSSVFVYLLLLTFEFVKTYLLIATSWSLWSVVLFKEIKYGEVLTNPIRMSFIIIGVLVLGSIILLSLDWTIWGVV